MIHKSTDYATPPSKISSRSTQSVTANRVGTKRIRTNEIPEADGEAGLTWEVITTLSN